MADISILARLVNGYVRNVDLASNTPVVASIKIGGVSNTELTKTILDRLVSLQDGSDLDATYHTHDGRYFTETELSAAGGAALIGVDDTGLTNISGDDLQEMVESIDTALDSAGSDELVKISASDTTPGYLAAKVQADIGTNSTNALEESILNPAGNEILRVRFDASKVDHGALAGLADDDHTIYIKADGTRAFSGDQSMGSNELTNVANPTDAQSAATKSYVDSLLDGRSWKQSARVASTADIDLSVAADPSPVDGITLADNDRILLKNQTTPEENGIYIAVDAEDPTTWVRSSDANTALELTGAAVFVEEGTASGDKQFAQSSDSIVLGTTAIVWVLTSANSFSGHDMVSLSGGAISVDLAAVSGLESTNPGNAAGQLRTKLEASNPTLRITGSNELAAKLDAAGAIVSGASGLNVAVDNSTIEKSGNALQVKDDGITLAKLAADSVDENKIVDDAFDPNGAILGGTGVKIKSNVDDSTIEIATNALQVKDAGITAAKLNSDTFDQDTILGGIGAAASVQHAPMVSRTLVAGESFAANTSFLVRWAVSGETAGRVYKADKDASVSDKFYAMGIALSTGAVSAGGNIVVISLGSHTLGSSDTAFGAGDVGKAVFLTAAGAFSVAAPSSVNEAVVRIGMVQATNKIDVMPQVMGVN